MKVLQTLIIISIFSINNIAFAQSESHKSLKMFNIIDGDKNEAVTLYEISDFYKDKVNKKGESLDPKKRLNFNTISNVI